MYLPIKSIRGGLSTIFGPGKCIESAILQNEKSYNIEIINEKLMITETECSRVHP